MLELTFQGVDPIEGDASVLDGPHDRLSGLLRDHPDLRLRLSQRRFDGEGPSKPVLPGEQEPDLVAAVPILEGAHRTWVALGHAP